MKISTNKIIGICFFLFAILENIYRTVWGDGAGMQIFILIESIIICIGYTIFFDDGG
jgi:hypothetical protein